MLTEQQLDWMQEGIQAFEQGWPRLAMPYTEGTAASSYWVYGWQRAHQQGEPLAIVNINGQLADINDIKGVVDLLKVMAVPATLDQVSKDLARGGRRAEYESPNAMHIEVKVLLVAGAIYVLPGDQRVRAEHSLTVPSEWRFSEVAQNIPLFVLADDHWRLHEYVSVDSGHYMIAPSDLTLDDLSPV